MQPHEVTSVDDLIRVMGGPSKAAKMFGVTPQLMTYWRRNNRIPGRYFLHRDLLKSQGVAAPASLWDVRLVQDVAE